MNGLENEQLKKRLSELASRSERTGQTVFSDFLSPQDATFAQVSGRHAGVSVTLFGGWNQAERCVAAFDATIVSEKDFPIRVLEITWPHQTAPRHQDILGAILGLGLTRDCIGDIILETESALLFCRDKMANFLMQNFLSAGKCHVKVKLLSQIPQIEPPKGEEIRCTVASLRMDAVICAGFHMSRTDASGYISQGLVQRNHLPETRSDVKINMGDVLSVRGEGRLIIDSVGSPTKKDRLPLLLRRFGKAK